MEGSNVVLVVEDHELTSNMLCRLVERAGLCPQTAATSANAIRALARAPALRALIADIHLGEHDPLGGLSVVRIARKRSAMLPILVVTGFSSPQVINQAFRLHAQIVTKPLESRDLHTAFEFLKKARITDSDHGSTDQSQPASGGELLVLDRYGLVGPTCVVPLGDTALALLHFLLKRDERFTNSAELAANFLARHDRAAPVLARQYVTSTRRALGAYGWLIETVPKRGYRIAPTALLIADPQMP